MEKLAYSLSEVCELTGLSMFSILKQLNEGNLVDSRIGGRRLIMKEEVNRWLLDAKGKKLETAK